MGNMKAVSKVNGLLAKVCSWISAAVIALLMIFITFSIISRFLGYPILGDVELVQLSLVILIMASLAYTEAENKHIAIGLFVDHLPKSIQRLIDIFSATLTLIVGLVVAVAFYQLAVHEMSQSYLVSSSLLKIPLYPLKLFVSLGFLLWGLQALFKIMDLSIKLVKNDYQSDNHKTLGG
jgi:TRAP-type C4-dicarboxylate transport system permease small subunit